MFGGGLVPVATQAERADRYFDYARGALQHPQIVGVNWFQYMDQPLTGRPLDGENFAIGFLSITDQPYTELVTASRKLSRTLYERRSSR